MVRWCRIGTDFLTDLFRWLGLVRRGRNGLWDETWIIDATTTHCGGSIRSANANKSNLRIEPRSRNRDRPGDSGRLSDLISPSPSSVWANQWEEPSVRKLRANRQ